METVTVKMMMEALSLFPPDAPVFIDIDQYNQRWPIATEAPRKSVWGSYATMEDGTRVKIKVSLPSDETTFMFTSTRKKK